MHYSLDPSLSEEEKAFCAKWDAIGQQAASMGQHPVMVKVQGISAEQAHQVAMQAAITVAQYALTNHETADVGSAVAKAYLQAYQAVEGWTKPEPLMQQAHIPMDDPLHPDYKTNFGGNYDVK